MATTTYGSPYVDGTDLVANWPAASLTVAQSIDAAGYYIGRGNNTQTGSYTTVLTDAGKVITMSNASANTVTIPANSSVAYVIGSRINILNLGAGACTPTAAAGVTINGTITALATNGSAAVIKTATNTWSYVPFGSGVGAAVYSDANTGTYTGYAYKTFTGSSTLTVTTAGLADVVILAGGGAGGYVVDPNNSQGGGGAGGLYGLSVSTVYLPVGTHTVTVGAGGAVSASNAGIGNFSFLASFVAFGGGGAASTGVSATQIGACGGGAPNTNGVAGGFISAQGFAGGSATVYAPPYTNYGAGGGGGLSAVGGNGTTSVGGVGGAGTTTTIAGTTPSGAYVAGTYAFGGGGGGQRYDGSSGAGGSGGGGAASNSGAGTAGSANTGGGGGAGETNAGAGGSGIVIVRVAV